MYEVTCFHCGNVAHITPDAERCVICAADLKHLITPEYAAHYFYQRGAQLAEAGEITLALLEVDRGLRYQADAQLHLLAAILSKRAGNLAQMRQHVAAIPVDNPLRGEAEWLLRAQQSRSLSPAVAADAAALEVDPTVWPVPERRLAATDSAEATHGAGTHPVRKFVGVAALLVVAAFAAWVGLGPGAALLGTWLFAPQPTIVDENAPADPQAVQIPTVNPTATATAPLAPTTPALLPSPTPTEDVPSNLTQAPSEPVAASTPQDAVQPVGTPYDLKSYLQQSNQPELADLTVAATLQGVTLTLKGIVPMYIIRQDLVELAQVAPGVSALDTVDLLVRTPLTYTVVEGDNLWLISYKLYGEDRRAELVAANRTTLLDPSLLRVGQVLAAPPGN